MQTWSALWLLNLPAGEARLVNAGEEPQNMCVAFSPDSKSVALCQFALSFPAGPPCPFFFTPDGKAIVGGGVEADPVVHMWDSTTGKELQRWDLTAIVDREKL